MKAGKVLNRRTLLKAGVRTGVFGAFAAAFLVAGAKQRRLREEGVCSTGLCNGCEILTQCELPAAEKARQEQPQADKVKD